MKSKYLNTVFVIFIGLILQIPIQAQSWKFIKEKDGVKIYSRQEAGNNLQTFKGVAEVKVPAEKVFIVLENVNKRDWWDKNIDNVKLLRYEKFKRSQYYLVYKMPWPFTDRDIYVDATTTINKATGVMKLSTIPLAENYPEINSLMRIHNYKQQWTVKPLSPNLAYIELELYVDLAERFPDKLMNIIMTDIPINTINSLKSQTEKEL